MINLTREEAQNVLNLLILWLDEQEEPDTETAIETLRAKLSAPEPEPVAWRKLWEGETEYTYYWSCRYKGSEPLYRVPPQREFVGLTVDEIREELSYKNTMYDFARAIEAKIKEKNNG